MRISVLAEVLIATLGSLLTATEAAISMMSDEGHDKQRGDGMADRQLLRDLVRDGLTEDPGFVREEATSRVSRRSDEIGGQRSG